jgi:hypothetical protein
MVFPSYEEWLDSIGEVVKWWPASSRKIWLLCLSTGWRDWNGCLRTMIIIHKLPGGSFTFLQCLSGTEFPNLSGTPYIMKRGLCRVGSCCKLPFTANHRVGSKYRILFPSIPGNHPMPDVFPRRDAGLSPRDLARSSERKHFPVD